MEENGGSMRRSIFLAAALTLFATYACVAQSPVSASQQDPAPAQPQAASPDPSPATAAPSDARKDKKVWTNDYFSAARKPASFPGAKSAKSANNANKPADASYIAKTKKELDKLQGDISDLDKQIVQLKNFNEGEPVAPSGAVKINKSFNRDPVPFQMQELQDKKKQLQDQIDALLDEARKKGVEPGQLR